MNMKWLFHSCQRHAADLSLLAADALPEADRPGLEQHLAQCSACRTRLAELKRLSTRLARNGQDLPAVEPPPSLHRRWMAEVHRPVQTATQAPNPDLAAPGLIATFSRWLQAGRGAGHSLNDGLHISRRLAWGSIAVMWTLILFFRFSAPDALRPQVMATSPTSLRQMLLALRTGPLDLTAPTRPATQPLMHDSVPPATRRPGASLRNDHPSYQQSLALVSPNLRGNVTVRVQAVKKLELGHLKRVSYFLWTRKFQRDFVPKPRVVRGEGTTLGDRRIDVPQLQRSCVLPLGSTLQQCCAGDTQIPEAFLFCNTPRQSSTFRLSGSCGSTEQPRC